MLIHNYFFIRDFVTSIQSSIVGIRLNSCWGIKQEELYLLFENDTTIQSIFCEGNCLYALFEDVHSNVKNAKPRFRTLWGKKVTAIKTMQYERIFYFEFEDNSKLVFMLYGRHSNILYFDIIPEQPKEIFKFSIVSDMKRAFPNIVGPTRIDIQQNTYLSSFRFIPKEIADLYPNSQFNKPEEFYEFLNNMHLNWQLINNQIMPTTQKLHNNVFDVLRQYYIAYLSENRNIELKTNLIRIRESDLKRKTKALAAAQKHLQHLKNARSLKEIADLIMANLHVFEQGKKLAEVDDFYLGGRTLISIPDNHSDPVKYAEKLYKKSRGIQQEIEIALNKIQSLKLLTSQLQSELQVIQVATSFKELKKYSTNIKKEQQAEQMPYHEYCLGKYIIRIGKNAKSNDEILTHYSGKNDLWLHAKDYSGSHVFIKRNNKKENIPEDVIQKAASWAAWFSKGKTQTLLPVIVTERKYVRKGKHLKPGQVIVEKERTVIVKPIKPDS
ncbi:MAG: DUF814 domain-containing protein [Bacteroidia bacterium]|nr:DUF814 domain-containing protein [Bacteroidia bacterium]MCO5253567.1 NFACT RNA binding domain-containing protein [Bacteroidota bacterium]